MHWGQQAILLTASALAGMVNSVAGGGTLLTFPALLAAHQASRIANATSTVALWPGQMSSLFGYRKEIGQSRHAVLPLVVLGTVGGILGALLLLYTPSRVFDKIVPFLVLLATSLFMVQEPLSRWQHARQERLAANDGTEVQGPTTGKTTGFVVWIVLFLVAIYGGYFGAGIGILILAALGFLGFSNIHQMNGIKNIFTLFINGVASIIFVWRHLVDWHIAALMAVGSIFGGYAAADIARKIGQRNVRRVVITIGFVLTLSLLRRALTP